MAGSSGGEAAAWADAREFRRSVRLGRTPWWEFAVTVYNGVAIAMFALLSVADLIGDEQMSATGVADVARIGPEVVGVVVALAVTAGARTGARGGPFTPLPADIVWEWLGPVPYSATVHRHARLALAGAGLGGAVAGAAVGIFVARRLPGATLPWLLSVSATGMATLATAAAVALVALGRRWAPPRVEVASVAVVALAVGDLVVGPELMPTSWLGRLALAPMAGLQAWTVATLVAVAAVALAGWSWSPGLSLERLEERSRLVSTLRFAVVTADVRAAILLRRRLLQDLPRRRPWFALPTWVPGAVTRRTLHAVLRWSWLRVAQVAVMAVVAGLSLAGFVGGTTPLIGVAAAAMWVAGVDLCDALAGDVEHEDIWSSSRMPIGAAHARHLAIAAVLAVPAGALMALVAQTTAPRPLPIDPWVGLALPTAASAAAGGALTVTQRPRSTTSVEPLAEASTLLSRLVGPVVVAGAGLAGIIGAHPDVEAPIAAAVPVALSGALLVGIGLYLRLRGPGGRALEQLSIRAAGLGKT